jgi:hypothetical protein
MTPGFETRLQLESLGGDRWALLSPLRYQSARPAVDRVVVPAGFQTDLESVPRWLPLAYALLRDTAPGAGVVHDYLYASQLIPRVDADAVLYEAARVAGVAPWRAWSLWVGVRIGGWVAYGRYAGLHTARATW